MDYLRNEKSLSEEYPKIFQKLLRSYPIGVKRGQCKLVVRGDNTLVKLTKKLKSFFVWLYETDKTKNRPFEGIKIGSEKFGTPYYITIEERNAIADFDLSGSKSLEVQRDIFVFQCFVGCRVGDLIKLTEDNVVNGVLVYARIKQRMRANRLCKHVYLCTLERWSYWRNIKGVPLMADCSHLLPHRSTMRL